MNTTKKCITWFYEKKTGKMLGYLVNPYMNRNKKDLLGMLSAVHGCVYDTKNVRLSHKGI